MTEIENIISKINTLSETHQLVIVAIDGMPGGGKSTLMKHILKALPEVRIVKTDSFFDFKNNGNDLNRVKKEVLTPLKEGKTAQFKVYDWKQKMVTDAKPIDPKGIVIVEGICSLDNRLIEFYDYKIWIDCPPNIGMERALTRDKGTNRDLWEQKWIPGTVKYIAEQRPDLKCDIVISYKDIPKFS